MYHVHHKKLKKTELKSKSRALQDDDQFWVHQPCNGDQEEGTNTQIGRSVRLNRKVTGSN